MVTKKSCSHEIEYEGTICFVFIISILQGIVVGTCLPCMQVAGETETKGQIKLRFKTAAGKDVVCIRSFQLTQKASKMEYKAIESVLQTLNPHTGEVVEKVSLTVPTCFK